MEFIKIDHIVLFTDRKNEIIKFYCDILGMQLITNGERTALHFGINKINIHTLEEDISPITKTRIKGTLDICLITLQPLEQIKNKLHQNKIKLLTDIVSRNGAIYKLKSLYINDPDGNLIEISNEIL